VFLIENSSGLRFVFFLLWGLLVAERVENTFRNPGNLSKKPVKIYHRKFFFLLLASYLGIVLLSGIIFVRAGQVNLLMSAVGALILIFGVFLRRAAIKTLGEYWSVFIEIKAKQKRIKKGVYRYLKHPYYTAVVLELGGFALLCNAYLSFWIILGLQIPLLLVRVHYENRVLDVYGRRLGF